MRWTGRSIRYLLVDSGPNGMEDFCLDGDLMTGLGHSALVLAS